MLHQVVSGNKWRKLCYNLSLAKAQGKRTLVTFGGAYSNHIHAVAAAGDLLGFETIGLIRGEEPEVYGSTLAFAKSKGMSFLFLSRTAYREKEIPVELASKEYYFLPEGGTNELAIKGCKEIVSELLKQLDGEGVNYFCVPCGTGGTASGIIEALEEKDFSIGFSSLKGNFMAEEILNIQTKYNLAKRSNWSINNDYHFGGYAKFNLDLIEFMKSFHNETGGIALDPIYTGKMAFGVLDLIKQDYFPKGSNVVMIHTGGLQGIVGFNERFDFDLPGGKM